ncbi:MAG TPA: amino acid adenylation domain-containing protein [Cellvibrio sp.]|nr:amino acid adenylation domain-containing protein [Cellvibrio sp.]
MSIEWQRPLTDAQLGIWLGQQIDTASPRYNAAEYISLQGPLNTACFERALNQVVEQSITLQLRFKQTEDGPQQVWQPQPWHLEQLDFSEYASIHEESAPFIAAQEWMQADLAKPVDLQHGLLFTQALIKLDKNHHLWYQRIHHIACDGFAFALLTQMVAERYSELVSNATGDNSADIKQQLDRFDTVLAEDAKYRSSPAWQKDRTYWLEQYRCLEQHREAKQPRVPGFSNSTAAIANTCLRISSYISSEQLTGLQQLAAPLGVTWSEVLLACVTQMLYHQTAATEITLGMPVMNRMGSTSLRIPAMVMNIVPLKVQLQGIEHFSDLAQAVGQQLKKSRPHLRYRYENLKRDLGITTGQKLFGPVVNIMPFDRPLAFSTLQTRAYNLSAGPVEDISFAFVLEKNEPQEKACLRVDIDANPNRYTEEKIQHIQQQLHQQLIRVLDDSKAPLTVDKTQLSWLEGKSLAAPTHSVLQTIYQQVQIQPDAIALQYENHLLSYQQLAEQSANLAMLIADKGVLPDSVIALVLPRSESAIAAALACWLLDCCFVFLDPEAPQERNALIIDNAQPALIISEYMAPISGSLKQVTLQQLQKNGAGLSREKIHQLWQRVTQNTLAQLAAPAYLIYTSGSTGTPKGVIIGHTALAEFVASNKDSYNIQAHDRVLQFAPLHFDACIEEIFVTLSQGARLVLRNSSMLESMPIFLQQCAQWKISLLDLPTAFWHELAFACKHLSLQLPDSLRAIIIGGEAVITERVEQWRSCFGDNVALFNTYGPSEATVIATCVNLCSSEQIQNPQSVSIGTPLSGRAIAIVDENLQILPNGDEGELLLTGLDSLEGGLAQGYLHLEEKTAQAFIALDLPWLEKPTRAYRTGDRVKINSHKHIEFIGRLDDQIKISGYRIDPLEVEAALMKLEGVREAAVVAVANAQNDKVLIAHVVSDLSADNEGNNEKSTSENIQQWRAQLNSLLPAPMLPSAVLYHRQLPKNSSGKIDRKELQRQSRELNQDKTKNTQKLSEQQQIIMAIWQEVLGQNSICIDDDFFALGGQSLQCIQVANRLSAKLQREIPVAWLFQHPSINALDKLLNESTNGNAALESNSAHVQMTRDCEAFANQLPVAGRKQSNPVTRNPCILLSGATGFVGAQLLAQLVKTGHKIICLVRASNEAAAKDRLLQALANQSLWNCTGNVENNVGDLPKLPDNIHIQLADLEQPTLGLSTELFLQLANAVDVVIHNAANTSVMRDYQSLRAANALSTGELLQLASIQKVPFHLISTVALADYDQHTRRLVLPEDFVPQHNYLRDGYQQSKWVAEQMTAIAKEKGYAVNVYRLARVTGDLDSAYVNKKDLVWNILQAGLPIGLLPDLHFEEPWTPVDKLAQFIVQHCLDNPDSGVLNLAPPKNVAIRQLYDWLTQAGQTFTVIPLPQWCESVKKIGLPQHQPIAEFFIKNMQAKDDDQMNQQGLPLTPIIHHQKFDQTAAELAFQLPVIDQQLFNRYFAYASARDWFEPVKQQPVVEEFAS